MEHYHTDSAFTIGTSHAATGKPCQDFALAHTFDGFAYAVVSDGCSSGGITDVGARLVGLTTATAIRAHHQRIPLITQATHEQIERIRLKALRSVQAELELTRNDMLATSLYAYLSASEGCVVVQGDGVVALSYTDGTVELHRFEWPHNMPFYPIYIDEGLKGFIQAHGGKLNDPVLTHETWICSRDTQPRLQDTRVRSLAEGIHGVALPINALTLLQLDFITIFSDGVMQVHDLDWKIATLRLLAFKNTNGTFAKRRMNRFIEDARRTRREPMDDIAFAVIHAGHPQQQKDANRGDYEEHQGDA